MPMAPTFPARTTVGFPLDGVSTAAVAGFSRGEGDEKIAGAVPDKRRDKIGPRNILPRIEPRATGCASHAGTAAMPAFHLATFSCDVTPPAGHPLCGGWIEPVRGVDDPLWARGVILLGAGAPLVLCSVDWCGIR